MIQRPIRLSFTGGEISPWAASRVDLDMYARSATRIHNFTVTPFGGLCRRPGFRYIARAAADAGEVKLIPFQYSTGDAFLLEFTPSLLRFFHRGTLILDADGSPYSIPTPWGHPSRLRVQQINDVVYICCPDAPPMRLERRGTRDWVLADISWKYHPWRHNTLQDQTLSFQDTRFIDNLRSVYKITVPGSTGWQGAYGGVDYLRVSMMRDDVELNEKGIDLFAYGLNSCYPSDLLYTETRHTIGRHVYYIDSESNYYFFTCINEYRYANKGISANPADYPWYFSPGIDVATHLNVEDTWEFRTTGTWSGEWAIRKSYDGGSTWLPLRTFQSTDDSNFIANGDESGEPCALKIYLVRSHKTKHPTRLSLRACSHKTDYIYQIKEPVPDDPESCYAIKLDTRLTPHAGTSTDWSLSAFGATYGYPGAMTWHQNRLVFAGTPSQPQTLWISKTDDYHNFRLGSADADALELTIAAGSQNRIQWVHSQQRLFLGTSEGEWTLDTSDGRALSPSNARFICHSHQGSEGFAVQPMESSLLFVQRGGQKIRELSYNINSDGYATTDLNIYADHLLASGVADLTLYRDNEQSLWIVRGDGTAAAMCWIPGQNILAWNRQLLSGGARLLSVASLHNESAAQELWAVIERDAAGSPVRTIEMLGSRPDMPPADTPTTAADTPPYLDSWQERPLTAAGTLEGLAPLAGCSAAAYPAGRPDLAVAGTVDADGAFAPAPAPPDGEGDPWIIGIPYESLITTTPFDYLETASQLKNHVATQVFVLHSHPGMQYASVSASGDWYDSVFPLAYTPAREGEATPYYTGYVPLQQAVIHQEAPQLSIRTSSPHPLNILSITPRITFEGDLN